LAFRFAECCPGVPADPTGQDALPPGRCVQVDERGASTVIAHARHQLTGIRACVGDELIPGVPQVMVMPTPA